MAMHGLLNTRWQESDYSSHYMMGVFRDDDLEIRFRMSTTPAYCGAMFVFDFIYSNTLMNEIEMWDGGEGIAPDLEEWNEKLRYFLCLAQLQSRHMNPAFYEQSEEWKTDHVRKALNMDFTFWEIEDHPMYHFGMEQGMPHLPPRINPNSGNLATLFSAPFGLDKYVEMHKKYGDLWVDVIEVRGDYPDNIDGKGDDECDGLDMEDW